MLVLASLFSLATALSFHLASPRQRLLAHRLPAGRRHAGLLALVSLLCAMQALGPASGLLVMLAMTAAGFLIVPLATTRHDRTLRDGNS